MFRITNRMLYNNTLTNIFAHNQGLLKAQEELSSGKRVNRPSDDPISMGDIMNYQALLSRNSKFQEVAGKTSSFINLSESFVASTTELAVRARELALSQVGGAASSQTRAITATEINSLLDSAIQVGNSKIGGEYAFSGRASDVQPIDSNGYYNGDHQQLKAEVNEGLNINMSVLASDFLAADLSPQLDGTTAISALNGGSGVAVGDFDITDRVGGVGTVSIDSNDTIDDVISKINGSGANVTASISSDGMSIQIVDNNSTTAVTQSLVIAESGSTTAEDLGLLGARPASTITGNDLSPSLTTETLLSDLYGGSGLSFTDVALYNGSASATVSFSTATTIGDVIDIISGAGVSASGAINSAGTALTITSTNSSTVVYAQDTSTGTTAELLGIGGGRNLITTLQKLELAMERNDTIAIGGLTGNLGTAVDSITALQGKLGARAARLAGTISTLGQTDFDAQTLLSNAQDADLAKSASDLALLQTAYQATVKSAGAIIQPTLLDFLS